MEKENRDHSRALNRTHLKAMVTRKEIEILRFLTLLSLFLVFLGGVAIPDAKAQSFSYRMSVTVNASQVQNGPLSNFPFLFSSTNNNLRTTVNGGHVTNANGYDIIFRAVDPTTCGAAWDGNGCTLSYEIESMTGRTVPSLPGSKSPQSTTAPSSISTMGTVASPPPRRTRPVCGTVTTWPCGICLTAVV